MTPVDAVILDNLLKEFNYNDMKREFLVKGFKEGFDLGYDGPLVNCIREAPNLKLRVGSKSEMWGKIMNEVKLGRYAGPFKTPPFEHYVQSPIGQVPKDKGKKTRLIFHLSYPKDGDSVNSGIPKDLCRVVYPTIDKAVKICLQEGVGCSIGKSDMSSAFRHVPLKKGVWHLLVMKATNPNDGLTYYFVDKCHHLSHQSVVQYSRMSLMPLHT